MGAVRWEAREDGQETSGARLGMLHEVWGSCPSQRQPNLHNPSQPEALPTPSVSCSVVSNSLRPRGL